MKLYNINKGSAYQWTYPINLWSPWPREHMIKLDLQHMSCILHWFTPVQRLQNVLFWGLWTLLSTICCRISPIIGWCAFRTFTNLCCSSTSNGLSGKGVYTWNGHSMGTSMINHGMDRGTPFSRQAQITTTAWVSRLVSTETHVRRDATAVAPCTEKKKTAEEAVSCASFPKIFLFFATGY